MMDLPQSEFRDNEQKIRRIIAIIDSIPIPSLLRYKDYIGTLTIKDGYNSGLIIQYAIAMNIISVKAILETERLRIADSEGQ